MTRATLTYSIPLYEVPQEAAHIISKAVDSLDFSKKEVNWVYAALSLDGAEEALIQQALDKLDSVRILLADIDQRLADTQGVLAGYLKVQNAASENEPDIVGNAVVNKDG